MMTIEIGYCYIQYRCSSYLSVLDEAVYSVVSELAIIFMLLKVTGKRLFDRNTFIILLLYRLHGNIIHIVIVTLLILLLSLYRLNNRNNMDIDCSK